MDSYSPLISIVVLNWNGRNVIEKCLRSLQVQTYQPVEIIVVDNASTDESVDLVRRNFPNIRLMLNGKNLGFGGGNNIGIQASKGRYIMILNNDTRLDPRCVEELKQSIEKSEGYGACASKILLEYDPHRIDAAGLVVCPDGLSIGRGRLEPEDQYQEETEVFFGSGCACLYRRQMLDDIGLYDEDFFAYAEDADMGWRARLAGWKCIYNPKAVVYHLHSASSGNYSHMKAFLVERNRIWVAVKHFPLSLLILGQFYTLSRYFFQAYGAVFGKGAAGKFTKEFSTFQLVRVLVSVYFSVLKTFPIVFKKRVGVRKKKKISDKEIYQLLKKFRISARDLAFKE